MTLDYIQQILLSEREKGVTKLHLKREPNKGDSDFEILVGAAQVWIIKIV